MMSWTPGYKSWQDDFARPAPRLIGFKHVIVCLVAFVLLGFCIAFFPLTVIFVPKPQLDEYVPKGVFCATCREMWKHNRDLFNREDMLCYGPPTYGRPTTKDEEVMFSEAQRCWALKRGHDEWMRPFVVTDEETRKWDSKAQAVTVR